MPKVESGPPSLPVLNPLQFIQGRCCTRSSPFEGRAPKPKLHAREHERASVALYCQTKVGHGSWRLTLLEDLSTHGFQLRRPPGANVGASLKIQVPGLEMLMVTVRWVTEVHAGCAFEKPLSLYVFEHIVRQANG